MYPNVDAIVRQAIDAEDDRPIVLSEYSHSMNNSNGNLHLYWRAFRKFERLQGGFIWDMIDQGLRKKAKDGRSYFGYGGDFGVGQPSDGQFCINGMFSPDRNPHPSVSEIKYLQQPVDIEVSGLENNLSLKVTTKRMSSRETSMHCGEVITQIFLKIQNLYSFCTLSHLSWRWRLRCNFCSDILLEHVASSVDSIATIDLSPAIKTIRFVEETCNNFFTKLYYLDLEGFLNKDTTWANHGHVIVTKQIPLKIMFNDDPPLSIRKRVRVREENPPLTVISDESTISVANGNASPFIAIDVSKGEIVSINWDGESILSRTVKPNFSRAATDNDRGGMELVLEFLCLSWATSVFRLLFADSRFSYQGNWRRCGISQDLPPESTCHGIRILKKLDDIVQIEVLLCVRSKETRKTVIEQVSIYEIYRDGRISIASKVKPIGGIPSLPRIGLSFALNPAFYNIKYFGRGPMENYPDRKSGSHFGWWNTLASEMGYNYIVPSENGSRSDCEQIFFQSNREGGLAVLADPGTSFNCSALLHSSEELHHASHTCDLDHRRNGTHPIYVNLDHQLMGVGGDDSWSPCVYPEFLVKSQEYNYKVWFVKVSSSEENYHTRYASSSFSSDDLNKPE
jgi:beta-galactosidase